MIRQKSKGFEQKNIPNNLMINLFNNKNLDDDIFPKSYCYKIKFCAQIICNFKV